MRAVTESTNDGFVSVLLPWKLRMFNQIFIIANIFLFLTILWVTKCKSTKYSAPHGKNNMFGILKWLSVLLSYIEKYTGKKSPLM